jgi:uncharacterized iron-regulated membrane protein
VDRARGTVRCKGWKRASRWQPYGFLRRLHHWLGAAAVAYVLFVSLSGCIVLFEHELYGFFSPDPEVMKSDGQRLSADELMRAAVLQYPRDRIVGVWDRRVSADILAELWLEGEGGIRQRLFHPYTGVDLGDAHPFILRVLVLLRDAHMNLLAGRPGRITNGIASLSMVLLSLSGAFLWIRGLKRARAQPERRAPVSTQRTRNIHRRTGVWMLGFVVVWGATGTCLAFPSLVHGIVGSGSGGEAVFEQLYAIHSGAAGGWLTKTVWAASGLLTSLLALTGVMGSRRRAPKPIFGDVEAEDAKSSDHRRHRPLSTFSCRPEVQSTAPLP